MNAHIIVKLISLDMGLFMMATHYWSGGRNEQVKTSCGSGCRVGTEPQLRLLCVWIERCCQWHVSLWTHIKQPASKQTSTSGIIILHFSQEMWWNAVSAAAVLCSVLYGAVGSWSGVQYFQRGGDHSINRQNSWYHVFDCENNSWLQF